jgi:hypothetical protein
VLDAQIAWGRADSGGDPIVVVLMERHCQLTRLRGLAGGNSDFCAVG